MSLPDLNIKIANGALGRVEAMADGVAGLLLTGTEIPGKLELNKVYPLNSPYDLTALGVTKENNPLIYKDVNAFYAQTGDGAELYLLVVDASTKVSTMCSNDANSPLRKLIDQTQGRIRLVGVNSLPDGNTEIERQQTGIDPDVVQAAGDAQLVAESYAKKINPFRVLLPALAWDKEVANLYKPRETTSNRVGFVMACDVKPGDGFTYASPAIGQVLGRAAASPVNNSIARVKSGAIASTGYLSDGSIPEDSASLMDTLHDAGYIFYRTFISKNGYYLNDDCMAAPLTDDYSNLNLGRVIDKAMIIVYSTYISEINDNVTVDENGNIPQELCKYFEGNIETAIATNMNDEISSFSAYIDPKQNILSSSRMDVVCKIVPKGILRDISVTLGFENPAK